MKELEEATKGRDINAKVLASHWGTVVLVLLVDIGKTQSLLGEETLSWVHSAVSLWVFSPMWLLRRFSAVAASPGRVPASMGGGVLPAPQGHSSSPPPCHQPRHTTKITTSILSFNRLSKENWEPASLFSALIALSSFRLPFKVRKCTFFHVDICGSLPASWLWAP